MTAQQTLLDHIERIARIAGDEILKVYNSGEIAVELKDDSEQSPLTKADTAASTVIVAELAKLSTLPVVSEENDVRDVSGEFWLVDPLDGTKEFIKKGNDFTVNIALIRDGAPVLGAVYAPVLETMYSGLVDTGVAWKEDGTGRTEIRSDFTAEVPVVVASKSHKNEATEDFLNRISNHELSSIGSSLKLCLVAEGSAMLYPRLGPTCLWDTAAADAVVRAAGGRVTNLEGTELVYRPAEEILNPYFIVAAANNTISWKDALSEQ